MGEGESSSFIKEHYTFCDIVISKRVDINNSHGELWGVMDGFICIIYDLQNRLVMMNLHSHGAYMIFLHEFYNSNARKLFNKWYSDSDISHFSRFNFIMDHREGG